LGVPRAVLSNRLERLVDAGVFARMPVEHGRFEYRLAEAGLDLWRVMLAIWDWETVWNVDPNQMRLRLRHQTCGRFVRPMLTCSACQEGLSVFECEAVPGPGAGFEPAPLARAHRRAVAALRENSGAAFPTEIARVHGDRWAALLIGQMFQGKRRFGEFRRELGISPALLSARLEELIDLGFIRRHDAGGPHGEYRLSAKGIAMFATVVQMIRWADTWLGDGAGPPVLLRHKRCGAFYQPEFRCSHCREVLQRASISLS
jgi:DNA-binding HxlR family transcriptional regulator